MRIAFASVSSFNFINCMERSEISHESVSSSPITCRQAQLATQPGIFHLDRVFAALPLNKGMKRLLMGLKFSDRTEG